MIQEFENTVLAHYQLQRLLARGGMSVVYTANDTQTGHTIAIKLVHSSEREYYLRFQREVQVIASLRHEHILPAFAYGVYDSWYYIVMPYIAYGTLKQRLAKGPISARGADKILTQLADALQFAHARGIVHGDIKPSNILLQNGTHVYLADFGLARHVQETSTLAQTSTPLGTPEYMAPELIEQPASPSSDIYALGVVLYQMLTGRLPFKSSTSFGLYWKHLREQPAAPSVYNPTISRATDEVVLRALSKNPAQRFQNVQEFADAYHTSLLERDRSVSRIHLGTPAVAAVLLLCIMPSLLGFSFSYLTIHAQAPTVLHASEYAADNDATLLTQPAAPQPITLSIKTPPFIQAPNKALMSQLIVRPSRSSIKTIQPPENKYVPKYIFDSI